MAENQITSIEQFAEHFRLKITRDECNDKIIQGSRAHLYFDGQHLGMMGLSTRVSGMSKEKIEALGGIPWVGDTFRDEKQRGYRDVWVKEIPPASYRKAIALARCRVARILTEEERERLRAAGRRLASIQAAKKPPVESVESSSDGEDV